MLVYDEVYQAALAAGSGGIRWNSDTNYIQLMDEDKNWVNYKYYDPEAAVELIPSMPQDSYNGYSISNNATTQSTYYPWCATQTRTDSQWYGKGNPNAYWQIMFPSEVYVNYFILRSPYASYTGEYWQQSVGFLFSGSNDGSTFIQIAPTLYTVTGYDLTTAYRLENRYNNDSYKWYRIQFTAYTHTSNTAGVGFSYVQFYGHTA